MRVGVLVWAFLLAACGSDSGEVSDETADEAAAVDAGDLVDAPSVGADADPEAPDADPLAPDASPIEVIDAAPGAPDATPVVPTPDAAPQGGSPDAAPQGGTPDAGLPPFPIDPLNPPKAYTVKWTYAGTCEGTPPLNGSIEFAKLDLASTAFNGQVRFTSSTSTKKQTWAMVVMNYGPQLPGYWNVPIQSVGESGNGACPSLPSTIKVSAHTAPMTWDAETVYFSGEVEQIGKLNCHSSSCKHIWRYVATAINP